MIKNNEKIKEEFLSFIQKELLETCDSTHSLALKNCRIIYPGSKKVCSWYHSSWQYLLILGKAPSPIWHLDFYINQFNSFVKKGTKILISGTADYTIMALIYFITKNKKINADLWVNDLCSTPLIICKNFAKKYGFTINTIKGDILSIETKEKFDIITSDSFLTRFDLLGKQKLLKKWNSLLTDDGKIITTTRIGKQIKLNKVGKNDKMVEAFENEVGKQILESDVSFKLEKIKKIAKNHISNITSVPFSSTNNVKNFFKKNDFKNIRGQEHWINNVGKPVKYYGVVAER